MITTIECNVIDQTLNLISTPTIASGNLETDKIKFEFSSNWDGLAKTAIFYKDEYNSYSVLIDENNEVIIPNEVLRNEGMFFFGVFGVSDEKIKTTEVICYRVVEGAIRENRKESDPTPDIYEQILTAISEKGGLYTLITNAEIDTIMEN